MPRDAFSDNRSPRHRIDVIEAPGGWMVCKEGCTVGRFDDVEAAYKNALALCTALFDTGVRAYVEQSRAAHA